MLPALHQWPLPDLRRDLPLSRTQGPMATRLPWWRRVGRLLVRWLNQVVTP